MCRRGGGVGEGVGEAGHGGYSNWKCLFGGEGDIKLDYTEEGIKVMIYIFAFLL